MLSWAVLNKIQLFFFVYIGLISCEKNHEVELGIEKLHKFFFRQIARCRFFLNFPTSSSRQIFGTTDWRVATAAQSTPNSNEGGSQLAADLAHVTASSDSLGPGL